MAVLALWATLEPLASKYIWEKHGVMTNTWRTDMIKLQQELEKTKAEVAKSGADAQSQKTVNELERRLIEQARQIEELRRAARIR